MSRDVPEPRVPFGVVLGDANVLYSRVLRDYLLYAAARQLIRVTWSRAILDEVVKHLVANIKDFDQLAGERLITAMNEAFPAAQVHPTGEAISTVADLELPDENDRHVLADAVSSEVDILCTDNIKDFPPEVMITVGIEVLTADDLLSMLVEEFGDEMLAVHRAATSRLPGATDESTLAALRRARATKTADLMEDLIG